MPKRRAPRSSVLLLAMGIALLACGSPRLLTRAVAPLTPGVTYFVPTQERALALAIDDGPDGAAHSRQEKTVWETEVRDPRATKASTR